jgi:hypothetical protein
MPFTSYAELQTAVLNWLARPGDPLVAPSVPDLITLFEREARRRLKTGDAEMRAYMTVSGTAAVALPLDCRELRLVTSGGNTLEYKTPPELPGGAGPPKYFTLHGRELRLGPGPSGDVQIEILYQTGVPPLSDANPTNWLLREHPDAYLYGTLIAAEAFIGHDERIALWTQAAAQVFESIEQADRKMRWSGSPLQIRPDIYGVPMAGAWTIVAPASSPAAPISVTSSTVLPFGAAGDVSIANGTAAPITVTLPPTPTMGQALMLKDTAGNAGTYPITIVPAAAGTIDGNLSYQLMSNYMAVELYWMGTQWGSR